MGGIAETANRTGAQERWHAPKGGHGFAAEDLNTAIDQALGHDAKVVGNDYAKNGPDRLVDGIYIQTKYCETGKGCIDACFDKTGTFRYMSDGHPMQIEVPKDKYAEAVAAMEKRIRDGQIPGVTDPKQANDLVRQGHLTYKQARNLARAGTVESLTYDAATGLISAGFAFGLTSVITFATAIWNGKPMSVALKNAGCAGLQVGGVAFVTHLAVAQLTKAGLNSALRSSSTAIAKMMGPKAYTALANAFHTGNTTLSGAAAIAKTAKILRSNIVTSAVTIVVLSSVDVWKFARNRISRKQLAKNIINTTASVVAGTLGYVGGAAAGTAIVGGATTAGVAAGATVGAAAGTAACPVVGTVIGLACGAVAGWIGYKMSAKATGCLIGKDDIEEMADILQRNFVSLVEEYLLTKSEMNACVEELKSKFSDGRRFEDMFASKNKDAFAEKMIRPIMERIVKQRKHIPMPDSRQILIALGKLA